MRDETKDRLPGEDRETDESRKTDESREADSAAKEYSEYERIPPEVLTVDRLIGARFDVGQRESQRPGGGESGPIDNPLPEPVRISRGRMDFDHPDTAENAAPDGSGTPVPDPALTFDVDIEDGDDFDI